MKPSTADAHTQKDATMHPSRGPPTPPQTTLPLETWGRRVSRSHPPQCDAPNGDEPPNRTQQRQKTEPSNPQGAETRLREAQRSTRGKTQADPSTHPRGLPREPPPALRPPFCSLLATPRVPLPSGRLGALPSACRGLGRVCRRFCRTPSSQAL